MCRVKQKGKYMGGGEMMVPSQRRPWCLVKEVGLCPSTPRKDGKKIRVQGSGKALW